MLWPDVRRSSDTLVVGRAAWSHVDRRDFAGPAAGAGSGRSALAAAEASAIADGLPLTNDATATAWTDAALASPPAERAALWGPNSVGKRMVDIIGATIALLVLYPLLVVVAIAVRIDTRGPIFFRQWRGGHDGRCFRIWKFRTMTCMEDGGNICQARPGDIRVTRVGRILRKTSIDELPQLFNVLCGDMSLVGPRPHALAHDAMYSRLIAGYSHRHLVKPGMTGWAQVNGCRGETGDLSAMQKRIRRDLAYIRHWSLRLDLIIMAKTVTEVLRPQNAY